MQKIDVNTQSHAYPIYIGEALLSDSVLLAPHIKGEQVLLVSNDTVAPLYLERVEQVLSQYQCDTLVLPDGEMHKNLPNLNKIFDTLMQNKHHRSTTLIALGGGVIGDMTGFAAACYQRGVNFIQIPTSLLAQVDASVGGKTAVNHPFGKNMIGAFHQPQAVIIDTKVLSTLPDREFSAGLAEVIKHGLIRDIDFFVWLEQNMAKLLAREPEALREAIAKCCQIKADVVSLDEKEAGIRATLNFGHTVGHALEAGCGYGVWLHGEAVAIGMVAAAELSKHYGNLTVEDVDRIKQCIASANLPIANSSDMTIGDCKSLMQMDKKVLANKLRFVLLNKLGDSFITNEVRTPQLDEVLQQTGFKQGVRET